MYELTVNEVNGVYYLVGMSIHAHKKSGLLLLINFGSHC
mgnify:CR=1 FL=1